VLLKLMNAANDEKGFKLLRPTNCACDKVDGDCQGEKSEKHFGCKFVSNWKGGGLEGDCSGSF